MKTTRTLLTAFFLVPALVFAQQAPQPVSNAVSVTAAATHSVSGGPINIGSRRELDSSDPGQLRRPRVLGLGIALPRGGPMPKGADKHTLGESMDG